ncbi:YjbH domain-containing protein [Stenotrophomonas sp. 364]|nr:YjbH domain-containing protein [Stenotrophomonas sp. 364]
MLALALSASLHAQEAPPVTASEWGGVGLLQTPTARMAADGDIAFTASHNSPYSRYNLTMQPFPWLEGAFRYINVSNIRYGSTDISGDQNYKDKSIDFKVRLWQETRWTPDLAFGVRDLGGTGFFSSEYLVASKNFGPVDASIGLATGYIGNRGDFSNPLGAIDDRFKDRRPIAGSNINDAGKFGASNMFKGPVGIFGGITYQTPWDALLLKVEYDGNDYKREPRRNNLNQSTPINVGLVYVPNRNIELAAAWERGDAAMFSLTFRGNPGQAASSAKPFDPAPVKLKQRVPTQPDALPQSAVANAQAQGTEVDWESVARQLRQNAGLRIEQISRRGSELYIDGYQANYYHNAKGMGRAARILGNEVGSEYDWYTFRTTRLGMPIIDASMKQDTFEAYLDGRATEDDLRRSTEVSVPADVEREVLYTQAKKPWGGGYSIGYRQNLGGPDGFILYQVAANFSGSVFFRPNVWLTGTVSADIINNYDKFRFDAPSNLPRVRTDLRQYSTTSDVMMPNLQLNVARRLGRDIYGMAYAGYLEWMYAGVGGELLYRPMGESWAVGGNLNYVRQRDYDQHFGLRDYSITTGHATLYYTFDAKERVVGSLSAGRYLAGDYGATINLARVFDNGMTMGAYATKTNVSAAEFGEGSFDKGIYFSIPLDTVLPRSTRSQATINWAPLIRDGGAMLNRKYPLYNLTGERDERFFYDNIKSAAD